jgi:hypothetical protein
VVVPGVTHHISPALSRKAPADLSTTVADGWLQLLQAAAAAARAVAALQQHTQATLPGVASLVGAPLSAKPSAAAPGLAGRHSVGSSTAATSVGGGGGGGGRPSLDDTGVQVGCGGGPMSGSPLAQAAAAEQRELTNMLKQVRTCETLCVCTLWYTCFFGGGKDWLTVNRLDLWIYGFRW